MNDPLIYARAVHFAATMLMAGVAFFIVFIAEPAFANAADETRVAATVRRRLVWMAWISLAFAVVSGAAWLVLTATSMSGQPPAEVLAQGTLWTVLTQTTFGNDWCVRCALACLLAAAFAPFRSGHGGESSGLKAALAILAAAFVGSLAWAGHAIGGVGAEGIVHPAADILHLTAAAAWVGALIPLALLLQAAGQDKSSLAIARTATVRFSSLGIVSVGTLLVTGIVNTWYLAGSVAALIDTDYGRLLLVKIALFFAMIAIATVNRLRLTPQIVQSENIAIAQRRLRALRRNAAIEAAAGAVVIMIVAVLGTLPPGSHAGHPHAEHPSYGALPADAAFVHIHTDRGMADVTILPGRVGMAHVTVRLWNDNSEPIEAQQMTVTLTAPAPGSKPAAHIARQDSDGAWQADQIELTQPGNWTVAIDAALGAAGHLTLAAPIVIEPQR